MRLILLAAVLLAVPACGDPPSAAPAPQPPHAPPVQPPPPKPPAPDVPVPMANGALPPAPDPKPMPEPPPRAPAKPIKGVIQAASNKDDVYVVSAGAKDGVGIADEFAVTRDGQPIATLVIDSVFPNHCAGHAKPGTKQGDLRAGDAVERVRHR